MLFPIDIFIASFPFVHWIIHIILSFIQVPYFRAYFAYA